MVLEDNSGVLFASDSKKQSTYQYWARLTVKKSDLNLDFLPFSCHEEATIASPSVVNLSIVYDDAESANIINVKYTGQTAYTYPVSSSSNSDVF